MPDFWFALFSFTSLSVLSPLSIIDIKLILLFVNKEANNNKKGGCHTSPLFKKEADMQLTWNDIKDTLRINNLRGVPFHFKENKEQTKHPKANLHTPLSFLSYPVLKNTTFFPFFYCIIFSTLNAFFAFPNTKY